VQRLVVIVQLRGRRVALARPARYASNEFEHADGEPEQPSQAS
jgi:hypothetical protein